MDILEVRETPAWRANPSGERRSYSACPTSATDGLVNFALFVNYFSPETPSASGNVRGVRSGAVKKRTPRRILVVEDDQYTASSFAELLKAMGHDATFVTDPAKVDDYIPVIQPHIAFHEIGMPRVDGWQVAERIRARYPADALRLIAITGPSSDEERAKSRRAGFDAHLLKPASPDLVDSILTQFFSRPG